MTNARAMARSVASQVGDCSPVDRGDHLVVRGEQVRALLSAMDGAGIVFLSAPKGFGKTSMLMQCAGTLREMPSTGDVVLRDASSCDAPGFVGLLDDLSNSLSPLPTPYVLLDGLPLLNKEQVQVVAARLRAMRDEGMKIAIACTPASANLIRAVSDSTKYGAPFLLVQPREYAAWSKLYAISPSVDIYALTRGIPCLVAEAHGVGASGERGQLERAVATLYQDVLQDLGERKDPLAVLLAFMVMMGSGTIADFERNGMGVHTELLVRLQREYPIVIYDAEQRAFRCLGSDSGVLSLLRRSIVETRRQFAMKTVRMLMRARRVDAAVALLEELCDTAECLQAISQFPVLFALHGHVKFIRSVLAHMDGEQLATMDVSVALAGWMAGLFTGEYKLARAMATELRHRAHEIASCVSYEDWVIAVAVSGLWSDCRAVNLPAIMDSYKETGSVREAEILKRHVSRLDGVLSESASKMAMPYSAPEEGEDDVIVTNILEYLDGVYIGALVDGCEWDTSVDERLTNLVRLLNARDMGAIAARARVVASVHRLMHARPLIDERAFSDASRVAVRESNLDEQLLMLLLEGWQFLMLGQFLNARFRAQQVQKLSDASRTFLVGWAQILERVAKLRTDARLTVREEAEQCDLSTTARTPAEAWVTAMQLSVARFDADLSAWFSVNRAQLLDPAFRMRIRVALYALGGRAESVQRLIPRDMANSYMLEDGLTKGSSGHTDSVALRECMEDADMVNVSLFGGFSVSQGGRILTNEVWKRRKAAILTARLALGIPSFVSKTVLTNELWPEMEPRKARQNLYVNLTAVRRAFGQRDQGPQYIVTQADGIALNGEYSDTDIRDFNTLAREILVQRAGVSMRQVVDAALKLEEVYKGPLYVPDCGDTRFFVRMRKMYQAKFIDCMMRGVDAAIEEGDLLSASWLSNAAIRQEPTREDVVRRAMRVMDLEGRRRELVELYQSHLHYVRTELHGQPERETRELYERIIKENEDRVLL